MKKLLLIISLVVFTKVYSMNCFAQALASSAEAAKHEKKASENAPGKLVVVVTQSFENKFSIGVHVENHQEGKFTVKLKSSTALLHKENVINKTYVRKYDMYNLPVGDYVVEVENGQGVFRQKISIRKNNNVRFLSLL